ncbi:hypothetical protein [Vibrio hippocampi]|uniref:Fimbrial protein n=1 Tax=Vibrio hippocampi TaxID=654686 RepID=A0ABN8DNS6_9VIBR|nr:hypothetical protein [Vibrio hippocampi]CAH0530014.1 hypothetical protein VHP8226_03740 [Vibrio hippocampi]
MSFSKKAVAIACGSLLMGAQAFASTGTVTFTGAVTSVTCDTSVVDGAGVAIPSNIIDLGTSAVSSTAPVVDFYIVSEAVGGGACAVTGNSETVWSSPTMLAGSIANNGGSATDATMTLVSKSATNGDVNISTTTAKADFTNTETLAAGGMHYEAQLVGGTVPGNFNTTGTYNVAYF